MNAELEMVRRANVPHSILDGKLEWSIVGTDGHRCVWGYTTPVLSVGLSVVSLENNRWLKDGTVGTIVDYSPRTFTIEWVTPPSAVLPYGCINLESWTRADAALWLRVIGTNLDRVRRRG